MDKYSKNHENAINNIRLSEVILQSNIVFQYSADASFRSPSSVSITVITRGYPPDSDAPVRFITGHKINGTGDKIVPGFSKIMKCVRVFGLMAIISYMTVILFTWIFANMNGYVYFSAGEPELLIKYPEWVLGFTGIFVAIDSLRKEIDNPSR